MFIGAFLGHTLQQAMGLAWIFPLLIAIETFWPREKVSALSRLRGVTFSTIYLLLTACILALVDLSEAALGIRPLFRIEHGTLVTGGVVTVSAALLSDFLYYWCHRFQHRFLWRFHAVHHAIRELSAVNAYPHWTEELMRLPFMTIPLALLIPAGGGRLSWVVGLFVLQSYYLHSNTRLHFGPLGRWISDNRFHRVHHSVLPEHFDKNFGVFSPLWDRLFGTACFSDEWPATGVINLPEPDGLFDYLAGPFRRQPTP